MNSSVFAVRSLLAVAICSNFSSARRIGKQLPPVPTSVMPGRQPGCQSAALPAPLPPFPHPHVHAHTASICHFWNKAVLLGPPDLCQPAWGLLGSSPGVPLQQPEHAPKVGLLFPPPFSAGTGGLYFSIACLKGSAWLKQLQLTFAFRWEIQT